VKSYARIGGKIVMGVEDFIEAEVGLAVAATAALFSPRARNVMRRGAVYGLAGALKAGDAVGSAARGVARGARGGQDEAVAPPTPPGAPARSDGPGAAPPTAGAPARRGGRQSRARSQSARTTAEPAEAQP
jgi:hypothetical protein